MDKAQQFLWIVQTTVLANAIYLTSQPMLAKTHKGDILATEVGFIMAEAVWASQRIPENMVVADTAHDFCGYMLTNLREPGETVPRWFART